MATYVDTLMQQLRINNPMLDKNEFRARQYGAWDFAMMPNNLVTNETRMMAASSMGRTIKIPVLNALTIETSSSRSCSGSDNDGVSALVEPSWHTISASFSMLRHRMDNNDISEQREWDQKMTALIYAFCKDADDHVLSTLSTNKNQVFNNPLNYTISSNTVNATWAQRNVLMNNLEVMMHSNDFAGRLHIIGDGGVEAIMNELGEHAVYNDVNRALELNNKVFHFDRSLYDQYKYATMYAALENTVTVLFRFTREQNGFETAPGHEFGKVYMPLFGHEVGYHKVTSVGDYHAKQGSGIDDMTCSILDTYIFDIDIAVVTSYNSAIATRPNPIIKANIASGSDEVQAVSISNTASTPIYTSTVVTNTAAAPVYASSVITNTEAAPVNTHSVDATAGD